MTLWLLAAGLLAAGPYHNARGYSGDARIDLGRVIPGHSYYYQAYFRNDTGVPLRLSGDLGCGTCPQLSVRGGKLAPGDSAELSFTGTVKKSLADSLWPEVRLHTDDGSRRGLWTYRFRFKAGKPSLVRIRSKPVEVSANKEGYLEGAVKLTSLSGEPMLIRPVGMPHGVRYSPEAPVRLPPRGSIALTFRAPPEFFTRHRSITLEAVPAGGGRGERLSLPFAP